MGRYSDLVNKPVAVTVAGHEFKVRQLPMSACIDSVIEGLCRIEGHSKGVQLQEDAMNALTEGKIPFSSVQSIFLKGARRDDPELDASDVDDLAAIDLEGMMDAVTFIIQGNAGSSEDEKKQD